MTEFQKELSGFIERVGIMEAKAFMERWFGVGPIRLGAWLAGDEVPPNEHLVIERMRRGDK